MKQKEVQLTQSAIDYPSSSSEEDLRDVEEAEKKLMNIDLEER